jgi:hypothetical protein
MDPHRVRDHHGPDRGPRGLTTCHQLVQQIRRDCASNGVSGLTGRPVWLAGRRGDDRGTVGCGSEEEAEQSAEQQAAAKPVSAAARGSLERTRLHNDRPAVDRRAAWRPPEVVTSSVPFARATDFDRGVEQVEGLLEWRSIRCFHIYFDRPAAAGWTTAERAVVPRRAFDRKHCCPGQNAASCSRVSPDKPMLSMVRARSAAKSSPATTDAMWITESMVGVGTDRCRARSVRNTIE